VPDPIPNHLVIRDIAPADEPTWRRLWSDYLSFYQTTLTDAVTDATWAKLFDPTSSVFGRVAVHGDKMIGFALARVHEGTWTASNSCYLEDLYVDQSARGLGAGKALIQDLVEMGGQRGWSRLEWHTAEGNLTARGVYDQFARADDHVRYRLKLAE
jgi:GNAT superfamily N-acetyltransferase